MACKRLVIIALETEDQALNTILVKVDLQRIISWCMMDSELSNMVWATLWLAISGLSRLLDLYSVFLSGECEGNVCSGRDLVIRGWHYIKYVVVANFKLHILKSERMFGIPGCIGIFARAK